MIKRVTNIQTFFFIKQITFPNIVDARDTIKKNEDQIQWEDLNESIESSFSENITEERFAQIEDLCLKALNNFPLLHLPVLVCPSHYFFFFTSSNLNNFRHNSLLLLSLLLSLLYRKISHSGCWIITV